jgi:hypothetical protein
VTEDIAHPQRPITLLSQNSQLRKIRVWNWTIPAWAGRFPDGQTYNTCPSAGICAQLCYARVGAYRFSNVKAKHQTNLRFVLDNLPGWEQAMTAELGAHKFVGGWVRIHDAGDFFSDNYTSAWLSIMRARPDTNFYAYTKEFDRFERLVAPNPPANFQWVFSFGGTQDARIDPTLHRVADVFPTEQAITQAGWYSQLGDDRLAVRGPAPVGMSANNIPHYLRAMGGNRFSELQAQRDDQRSARRARRSH